MKPMNPSKKHYKYDPKFLLKHAGRFTLIILSTVALTNLMMWDIRRHHKELDTYFEPKDKAKKNT